MKLKTYKIAILFLFTLILNSCAVVEDVPLSSENDILSFKITKDGMTQNFTLVKDSIVGKVKSDFELNNINLEVLASKGATITPDPATIKSISAPFQLLVTAENGDKRTVNVAISREPSIQNFILVFNINEKDFSLGADMNHETGMITKRVPEFIDLKNVNIDLKFSKYASISPDPKTIKDYSLPVTYTVKSETGLEKVYQVKLEYMNLEKKETCSDANAWKWFGGDNRTNAPSIKAFDRNIGTGQEIVLEKNLVPSVFSINLREGFKYDETKTFYNQAVTLKLMIRDENLNLLASTTTEVSGDFPGGFIPFDLTKLNLYLKAGKTYVFQWYLVNGESLGVTASSPGNTLSGSGFCFNSGYSGDAKVSEKTTLEDVKVWYKHEWHFSIELEGKE
ncbi:DUF5018 domain-containing protein [Flavobacterium branchiicola]|uniref:DUF1735 domain-containing protein n=1 Tax=Flavobacterium branchiicola TaxID=1114875 RepID=A0ABV9PJD9_9FLAO|nr:hypothetical protein [Flavobacterium branchiicola]MBS7256283.1 hypothetical protein [Flavobacterium branchiicola]